MQFIKEMGLVIITIVFLFLVFMVIGLVGGAENNVKNPGLNKFNTVPEPELINK